MDGFTFTGIEPVIDWLEQTGLLDAFSQLIADVTAETLIALVTLSIAAIGSLILGAIALAVIAIVAIVTAIIVIVAYVLYGIGLSKIAKKLGVKHRFLAWIPYARTYLLGKCAEQGAQRNGKKPWKWSWILLGCTLGLTIVLPAVQGSLSLLLSFVPLLPWLISLILDLSSLILLAVTAHCLWSASKEFMGNVPAIIFAVLAPICDLVPVLLFVVGWFKVRPAVAVSCDEPVVIVVEDAAQTE